MAAKNFPEPAFGPVAQDGAADGGPGGHHADAGQCFGSWRGRRQGALEMPEGESLAIGARPALPGSADVALAAEVLPRAETHQESGPFRFRRQSGACVP